MKVKKMSYSDKLKEPEIDYIQYLYFELYENLQRSISYIYELENQDLISRPNSENKIKPLIDKYLYDDGKYNANDFIEFRSLIRERKYAFKNLYDIIKPLSNEGHKEKIYRTIKISDLYIFIPLIVELIKFYSDISKGLYKVCNEFIDKIKIINNDKTTNIMIINALIKFNNSIKLLIELLNFINTRKINKDLIERNIIIQKDKLNKLTEYRSLNSHNFSKYLILLKNIVLSFDNGNKGNVIINIRSYIDYIEKSITSEIVTDPSKTIKIFIADLKLYIINYFYELITLQHVNNYELKKILYEHDTSKKFDDILFIKNIKSLFKIIIFKISNDVEINKSIIFLLQYIIDLTINICALLVKSGNVNKYILKGIINIILLNKLKDYFESGTKITYSYYDYKNIEINISMDDVKIFILENYLEYDLDTNIIQFSDKMTEKDIYDNIDNIISTINYQYNYSEDNVTVISGGSLNNKYKKTENKITVIYNKKKYTRVIYICEHKKYVKLNKTIMLLSKLKKVF